MQTILLIRGKGAEIITQDEKITQEGQLEACNWLGMTRENQTQLDMYSIPCTETGN